MKTTNKAFKEMVQDHILECLSDDYTSNVYEQLENTVEEFKNWYSPYEQHRTPNKFEAFTEFLMGLPSVLSVEYEYYTIGKTLEKWFTDCGENYIEKPSEKESSLYYHLIVREFETLCNRYGVKF